MPDHPTGRAICPKGRAAPELVHSTNRLTRPLRRTQPKGAADPGWREMDWEEALDEIAARLDGIRKTHGPEAVAFAVTSPSGTPLSDAIDWIERFIRVIGSPNMMYATEICNWHKDHAYAFTFGSGMANPDYANSELILLWGHNPANTWLAQAGEIAEGQRNGTRLVVVDPRRTAHAARADHWLQVRPGTDAALALGIVHLLIAGQRFDQEFTRRWTNACFLVRDDNGRFLRADDLGTGGPDQYVAMDEHGRSILCDPRRAPDPRLRRAALHGAFSMTTRSGDVTCRPAFELLAEHCAAFTSERVADITSVPAAEIRATAEAIANARSLAVYSWTGVGQHTNASQTARAIGVLHALTGTFDAPGGNLVLNRQPAAPVVKRSLMSPEQWNKALGLDARPLGPPAQGYITARDFCHAVLDGDPYSVQGLFAFGANTLITQADTALVDAALRRLDFFVHCDLFETPTGRYADILLPVNTPWEREALKIGFEISADAEEVIQLRPRMVPPQGDSRSDLQIVFELATRLGCGDRFFDGDIEAAWNHQLAPLGITVDELRRQPRGMRRPVSQGDRKYADATPDSVRGFATETRRVEIYSEKLLRHGYAPLPTFDWPAERARWQEPDYPYVLTSAKTGYYCHSQHRSLSSVRRRAPEPVAVLSREIARRAEIEEGDWITLRTSAGQALFRARIDETLHPDGVVADYGWWQSAPDLGLPSFDPLAADGSNYNHLIAADRIDPLSGSVPHRGYPCDVRRWNGESVPRQWGGFRRFEIAERRVEAGDAVSLTFRPADGRPLPAFRPGQHVSVRAQTGKDRPVTRTYSLSCSAGHPTYRITIRRLATNDPAGEADGGLMSTHATRQLAVGDMVELGRPAGSFLLPATAEFPIVLIAAGIGITPFMSLLETLARDGGPASEIVLFYGNRNGRSHAFKARLAVLAEQIPGLSIINYYSRPLPSERPGRDFDCPGRLAAADIDQHLIDRRARFYLCGPDGLLKDFQEGLVVRGVPRFEIFKEVFRAQSEVALPPEARFKIVCARSDRTVEWSAANGTILDLAEAEGLRPPSGCRVGQCESCAVTLLDGTVQYLTEPEAVEPGTCLTCQAVPTSDIVLDL